MAEFVTVDRKTAYLLPPSVDDWLNEDHLAEWHLLKVNGVRSVT